MNNFASEHTQIVLVMKKIILLFCLLFTLNLSAQVARPKLIVGLVVDQMRWDYLYYYYDEYGKGRLKRLLNEGFSCDNTMINYVPTVTAIGHSSIFTGSCVYGHSWKQLLHQKQIRLLL